MKERYTVTLESVTTADSRPAIVRLRSLLKLMLRGFGLRCVTVTTEGRTVCDLEQATKNDN